MVLFLRVIILLVIGCSGAMAGKWLYQTAPTAAKNLLMAFGFVLSLGSTFAFQIHRALNDPPTKDLSPDGVEKMCLLFSERRGRLYWKWAIQFLTALLALGGGALMSSCFHIKPIWLLAACSYASLSLSFIFLGLFIVEYITLSNLSRELKERLDKEREQRKFQSKFSLPK